MRIRSYITLLFIFLFCSCNWEQKKNNPYENFNENDYYKVQGIVVNVSSNFNYVDKFSKRDIKFIYHLELTKPLFSVEKNSVLFFDPGDPVVVMLRKKDSTDPFIAHRGIFDEDLLVEYLTKEDSDYLEWLEEQ